MILFYSQDLSLSTALLEEDEYHHCCKVLRHKVGDEITVTNGAGTTAKALIKEISKKKATLELLEKIEFQKKEGKITLAVSPPKNRARWEWLLEKAVELGVARIIPMTTQRTERSRINLERSRKIMRSAALQSLRHFHPQIEENISFLNLMKGYKQSSDKYVAHYNKDNLNLLSSIKNNEQSIILVGPEGDFTDDEMAIALKNGYKSVNISSHRLRTETAAIIVVDQLKGLGY